MSPPSGAVDTSFERFLQELPEDFRELVIEFKAFTRSPEIKTPEQWLQAVLDSVVTSMKVRENRIGMKGVRYETGAQTTRYFR